MNNLILVFIGGGLGATLRYLINNFATDQISINSEHNFPFGTFIANILGSLIIGFVVGLFENEIFTNEQLRLFIIVGLLGGFTTFSSFSLEIVNMAQSGSYMVAVGYILSSIIIAIIFTLLGMKIGHSF
ncbi:MAG: fluoride efflux transporter CrcB [Chlorobiota bacterium]